ncbi:MAG TPA: hypothetical protein PK402_00575 [Tepidisphaeraceae bacterium]|nr:hypothetical protein [Tepidisphaeraceae bacterium]
MTDTNGQDVCDMLRNLAPQVSQTDQAAIAAVERIERFLSQQCKLELPSSTLVFQDDADGSELLLAYDQFENAFRILVVRRLPRRSASGDIEFDRFGKPVIQRTETTPWQSCDRATRFATLIAMPQLLENLTSTVSIAIEMGKRATSSVEKLLVALPE